MQAEQLGVLLIPHHDATLFGTVYEGQRILRFVQTDIGSMDFSVRGVGEPMLVAQQNTGVGITAVMRFDQGLGLMLELIQIFLVIPL
ncbi:MAG: hypothetical protein BWY76_02516 [bacterium ADurb.Bin429]|nr:MAG: hypothetical protein BWY76_02516 [bacterium ADurb.Bin429]